MEASWTREWRAERPDDATATACERRADEEDWTKAKTNVKIAIIHKFIIHGHITEMKHFRVLALRALRETE